MDEIEDCENCRITPGGTIRTYDMIHCAYCGRQIIPDNPSYADLKERALKAEAELARYKALANDAREVYAHPRKWRILGEALDRLDSIAASENK